MSREFFNGQHHHGIHAPVGKAVMKKNCGRRKSLVIGLKVNSAALCFAIALCFADAAARAQQEQIALKSGESVELGPVYWIVNCRSILKSSPVAEIMEGPPSLTVSVKEAMVPARRQQCPQEVPGGILILSAGEIKERAQGTVVIRIKFPTRDGERQQSREFKVSLFPSATGAPAPR